RRPRPRAGREPRRGLEHRRCPRRGMGARAGDLAHARRRQAPTRLHRLRRSSRRDGGAGAAFADPAAPLPRRLVPRTAAAPDMTWTTPELPTGVVTFLLTDVVGSVPLWERAPVAMNDALIMHDRIMTDIVHAHGGVLVRPRGEGDSTFNVFEEARDAADAA